MNALPIIPWIGGKRRLAKILLPMFPAHECYAEPFCGAAALYFMKEPAASEVINDANGELVNLYRVVQNHLEEFVRQFKWALSSRQIFEWQKMQPTEPLTDIKRAARFYYLQRLAFGGKVGNQTFGTATQSPPKLNLLRLEEDLSQAHLRLARTYIEHMDWAACVRKWDRPHTLFYCDPPYFGTEGYGMEFGLEQYALMAGLARTIQGKMVISVNDIPEMREAFAGLDIQSVSVKYTVGGQGRQTDRRELIIRNF